MAATRHKKTAKKPRKLAKKKSAKKSAARKSAKRWVRSVKTVSTFPPKDLFTKKAQTVARVMGSKKVSPKGIGSGIRMIQYFINRAGKDLPTGQKRELEKAKGILQAKQEKQRQKKS